MFHVLLRQLHGRALLIAVVAFDDAVDRPLGVGNREQDLIDRRVAGASYDAWTVVALAVLHVQVRDAIVMSDLIRIFHRVMHVKRRADPVVFDN